MDLRHQDTHPTNQMERIGEHSFGRYVPLSALHETSDDHLPTYISLYGVHISVNVHWYIQFLFLDWSVPVPINPSNISSCMMEYACSHLE